MRGLCKMTALRLKKGIYEEESYYDHVPVGGDAAFRIVG
jgi:hypothetical protein